MGLLFTNTHFFVICGDSFVSFVHFFYTRSLHYRSQHSDRPSLSNALHIAQSIQLTLVFILSCEHFNIGLDLNEEGTSKKTENSKENQKKNKK